MFNYHGRNKVPEYGFYYDGKRQTSKTQTFNHGEKVEPHRYPLRDGRIAIGQRDATGRLPFYYGTFVIDELVFFNRPVTEAEIKILYG